MNELIIRAMVHSDDPVQILVEYDPDHPTTEWFCWEAHARLEESEIHKVYDALQQYCCMKSYSGPEGQRKGRTILATMLCTLDGSEMVTKLQEKCSPDRSLILQSLRSIYNEPGWSSFPLWLSKDVWRKVATEKLYAEAWARIARRCLQQDVRSAMANSRRLSSHYLTIPALMDFVRSDSFNAPSGHLKLPTPTSKTTGDTNEDLIEDKLVTSPPEKAGDVIALLTATSKAYRIALRRIQLQHRIQKRYNEIARRESATRF